MTLKTRGDRARRGHDNQAAVEAYSQALELGRQARKGQGPELEYDLLSARAACYRSVGAESRSVADMEAMAKLARKMKDLGRMAEALWRLAEPVSGLGQSERIINQANRLLKRARRARNTRAEAYCLLAIAEALGLAEQTEASKSAAETAFEHFREVGNLGGQARCLRQMGYCAGVVGQLETAQTLLRQALDLARRGGDREAEVRILSGLGIYSSDQAARLVYSESSLELNLILDDQLGISRDYNNLSLAYLHLGLYDTAKHYAEKGVELARARGVTLQLPTFLESYARVLLELGDLDQARAAFEEVLAGSKAVASRLNGAYADLGLGQVELAEEHPQKALTYFNRAQRAFTALRTQVENSVALAFAGSAHLALGHHKQALEMTLRAIELIETGGAESGDYLPQLIWWHRYRALAFAPASQSRAKPRGNRSKPRLSGEACKALERAHALTFEGISQLQDQGLRRNYLNKVQLNRDILSEWMIHAPEHGLDPVESAPPGSNLQEQLRRMLGIGLKLNERRDADDLAEFIMEQFVELSGAERSALLLAQPSGELVVASQRGFGAPAEDDLASRLVVVTEAVAQSLRPALKPEVASADLRSKPASLADSLSVVCFPLIVHGQLIGVMYGDNHVLFGQFDQADIDLLSAFANQAAAAIENARLYQGLEDRVTERTAELNQANTSLNQRASELSIINSIQEALASKLDLAGVVEVVGDRISEILGTGDLSIRLLTKDGQHLVTPYLLENGQRFEAETFSLEEAIVPAHALRTGKPYLASRAELESAVSQGAPTIGDPGSPLPASSLFLPFFSGNTAVGLITVHDKERAEAFSEADVKLLNTLANSMSVALENARLFDETNLLLEETRHRNAELAVINSIQEGLASKLEFEAIIELVGEKIQDVFGAQGLGIRIYDPETDLVHYPYETERGVRLPAYEPRKAMGFSGYIIQSRKPLMVNRDLRDWVEKLSGEALQGTLEDKSFLGVPVIVDDIVRGLITLENVDQEDAFTESDQRLLMTIASSMGVALENARLFDETGRLLEETRQRNAELAVINSVQAGLASRLDLAGVVEVVGDEIAKILKSGDLSIRLVSGDGGKVVVPYFLEHGQRYPIETMDLDESSFTNRALQDRVPLVASEADLLAYATQGGKVIGDLNSPMPKSMLYVPILSGDRALGVISVADTLRDNAFGEAEINLIMTLANSMSVALDNARLFDETARLLDETRQRNAELALINSVQEALSSQLDIQAIFDLVGDKVRDIFDAQVVSIVIHDSSTGLNSFPYIIERGERLRVEPIPPRGFGAHIMKTKLPLMINEQMEKRSNEFQAGVLAGEDIKSYLGVPLLVGNEAKGVITLQNIDREHAFSESDLRLLTTLASSMSVALENARLFDETARLLEETQHRAAELGIINSVGEGLVKQLELDAIIELVGEKVRQVFKADTTYIALNDPKTLTFHTRYYVDRGKRTYLQPGSVDTPGLTSHIIRSGQPLLLGTIAEAVEFGVVLIPSEGAQDLNESFLGVPFFSGVEVTGVISVQSYQKHAFNQGDLRLLSTLASSMSVALENARLFEETNLLLDESRRHNLELAAISTISQALVAETELGNLIALVGDQVVETFEADIAYIALLDARTNMISFPYLKGEADALPIPFGSGVASQIIRTGEPLLLNQDVDSALADLEASVEGTEVASYLGVPITVGRQVIGVLSVQSTHEEDRFDDGDVRLLTTIAANTGAAISSARLYEETKQRASEMATINVIGQGLLAQMDLERVVELVGDSIIQIFEADNFGIGLFDPEARSIRIPYNYHLGGRLSPTTLNLGQGLSSIVVDSQKPLLLNTKDEVFGRGAVVPQDLQLQGFEPEENSWLGVPIMSGGEISGLIFANRYRNYAFDESDLRLLTTIAANMGVAIRNAQLYTETQRRAEEMAALNAIGKETSSTLDLPTVLDRITRNARQVLASHTAAAVLLDEDGHSLRATAADGLMAEQVSAFTWELGEGLVGGIVKSGAAERINDVVADPRTIELPGTEKSDQGEKLIVAPLISRERPVGAIAAWRDKDDPSFSQEDLDFVLGLSQQAVIAIQNAQLFDEAQKRAGQMEALNELGREISATLDLETVLNRITAQSRRLLHGDTTAVFMLEPDGSTLRVISADGHIADQVRAMTAELSKGMVGTIAKTGIAEVINDVAADPRGVHIPGTPTDNENKKLMAAPLLTQDKVLGVMAVWRGAGLPIFTQADLVFLASLARQATVAIENARLFDETQRQRDYSRALVENSPVAIVTTDMSGVVVSWNPAAERLFAYPAEEAIGLNIDSLITTDVIRQEAVDYTQQVWSEGRVNAVTRRARKDGSLVEVELLALPVSVSGVNTGLIAIYHDITELKRAERAVAEQKEYLEAVLLNTPVAIVTTDNRADVVSWNPAAEKLFGYTADEAAGEDIDELIARQTDQMHAEAEAYNAQASRGRLHQITQRNRKDGSLVDVELLGVPVNIAGEQTGIIAIYHDITELKRAEQELNRQKEYLEAVLKNSPAAIVTVDREFRVVSWNPAAEKLFGYPEAEALGHDIHELHSKDEAILAESRRYSEQVATGEHVQAITQRTRKDGGLVDVEVLGLPVMVDGRQVGNVIIYHDLTELLKAQREAEAANEAKSAFLATMSHEIRTPMNAVIGMSGLLLDTPLNDEQHEFAEIIRNSGDALLGIINDVLDFSKIEAGKMDLERQPFDLRECVEGTLDLVATRASEKGLDLAYVMEAGVPVGIIGDLTRLRQILLNLLTNAVKFTEQGEVVLTISPDEPRAAGSDSNGDSQPGQIHTLHFTVRDTGIGIPLERMDRLFQSFSQVDASTARKYGGTGLGLAISKRLSELMAGEMWAESHSGVGTTFHFTIRTEATSLPAPSSHRLSKSDPQLQGRRVLIVDDNDTNRRILTLQVQGWGMTPQDTASPIKALEWFEQNQAFDVAILDMHMPDMDGLTLAGEIRKLPDQSKLPMILFTSLGRRESGAEGVGFAALLTKPIKPSQLFDALMGIFSAEPVDVKVARSQPPRLDPGMAKRHPLRILLAEDNAVNQKLALRLLQQMGYRADVAANGLEAIESLERQSYDLVLMDVQMPEMDGLEASRQINARWSRTERPQIVAMTANALQGDRELCIAAGMDDYITKPIRVEELVGALDRVPAERSAKPHD